MAGKHAEDRISGSISIEGRVGGVGDGAALVVLVLVLVAVLAQALAWPAMDVQS